MRKIAWLTILTLGLVMTAASAFAAETTQNLTVNATVTARAKLTLEYNTINFPDADPDTTPSVAATENSVDVEVKVRTGASSTATLTHLAGGDLVGTPSGTIAISNVSWTATGSGFVAGTMSSSTPQSAGSWTGSGNRSGTFSYFLANSWDYVPATYTASSTYTLTAP